MYKSAMVGPDDSVRYLDNGGKATVFTGGSRSWRSHNPGLVGHGLLAIRQGAIGKFGNVAIFGSRQDGRDCLLAVLAGSKFANLKVVQAYRRFDPGFEPYQPEPPSNAGPDEPPPPPECPHTAIKTERLMADLSSAEREDMADVIEHELIGWEAGEKKEESLSDSESAASAAAPQGSNVVINGRTAVHAGSKGRLMTPDICKTPTGNGCSPTLYNNQATSSDADGTAGSVKINGNPACIESSTFAKSSGDAGGSCGGIRSGTTQGPAHFQKGSGNVQIEGEAAVRQFDLMTSNDRNTPPMPLMQGSDAKPPEVAAEAAGEREGTERGAGVDLEIAASETSWDAGMMVHRRPYNSGP